MAYKLSPSSLNLYKDCPKCFWLLHIKKIKRPEGGAFPSLPGGIDRMLKKHFDSHRASNTIPKELSVLNDPKVKLFADMGLLNGWRNNLKGISLTDNSGNILRGAVDEVLQKGEKLIVMDFKTRGAPANEETHKHYIDQLNIYNYLLRKNNHKTEDYSYLLYFHPREITEKGTIVFNVDPVKIPVDLESVEKLWKDALKTLGNEKEPAASKECAFCNWSRVKN